MGWDGCGTVRLGKGLVCKLEAWTQPGAEDDSDEEEFYEQMK